MKPAVDRGWKRPGMAAVRPGPGASHPRDRRGTVNRVLGWVLVANLAVVAARLVVGARSGATAVLGIAADSGVDALNNVVALLAIWVAARPPDAEHPYGHGKFETLGALAIVSFLSITAFELTRRAISRLVGGGPAPALEPATFWVLGATLVVNVGVALSEARMGRNLESEILRADARHTTADVLITAAVMGGEGLVAAGWGAGDAWLGLLVVGVIIHSGWQILRETVPVLVDRRAIDPAWIREMVAEDPGVRRAVEIRSRGRPGEAFAELTIHVDPESGVREAHEVADRIERLLEREGGFSAVTVHIEPDGFTPVPDPSVRPDAGEAGGRHGPAGAAGAGGERPGRAGAADAAGAGVDDA
ncbi:MAG TPA: cation diffusion facilitator family transporter [Gemmatimonadota bacterium]|nr:cation diffusion facilitator family transporter [Gemmatimonadota bacterium]